MKTPSVEIPVSKESAKFLVNSGARSVEGYHIEAKRWLSIESPVRAFDAYSKFRAKVI